MNENDALIVWLIDEDEDELDTYSEALARAIDGVEVVGRKIEVRSQLAFPRKEDYLDIVNDPNTGTIIVDQRLKETGVADHTGIELALFLREKAGQQFLPIYILTNYAMKRDEPDDEEWSDEDELEYGEWSVEDVLSKKEIRKRVDTVASRLLRGMGRFTQGRDEREQQFQELLIKSLHGELSEMEAAEFASLEFERTGGIVLAELPELEELRDKLKEMQDLSRELEDLEAKKEKWSESKDE